jgi:DNA-binding transcriptional MerR regulator
MATPSGIPTFNLKAVLLETGLKADTLRAWERRYGLPRPQRTAGRHRLYSQRDMEVIKWLIDRQQEGMSISRAVELWRSLEVGGQDPLHMVEFAPPEMGVPTLAVPKGEAITELRRAWTSACMDFDEPRAERVMSQAFALFPAEVVCLELLQKGLSEVGEGWYRGEVSVQQEHFTSELAVRRLEALLAATSPSTRPERVLIACPPNEEHTFSPLLLALFLRRRGWDVLYLGANVPLWRLEETMNTTQPRLVIMPAQQLHTAATLLEAGRLLQEQRVPLAFGGLVFNLLPALRERIPGYFLGERLEGASQAVEQALFAPPPAVPAASWAYEQALTHYRERQAFIEAHVLQTLAEEDIPYRYLSIANANLSSNITAALRLGDVNFVGVDIEWVAGLLSNYRLPGTMLRRYLEVYYQAATTHLDQRSALIVDWLARVTRGSE